MNKIFDNKQEFTELYRDAVMSISGKSLEAASDLDRFNALAKLVAEKARTVATKSDARVTAEGKKRVYYFSIEFLIGRLLDNYLLNFGVRDMVAEALDDMGFDLSVIENQEPDPALGNGGGPSCRMLFGFDGSRGHCRLRQRHALPLRPV